MEFQEDEYQPCSGRASFVGYGSQGMVRRTWFAGKVHYTLHASSSAGQPVSAKGALDTSMGQRPMKWNIPQLRAESPTHSSSTGNLTQAGANLIIIFIRCLSER
ncbi:MAG TPA: hypothetical protein VHZ52_17945 [Acidobacteriaceae bacterium]|jgi:hypothetical protein|nr:hypothetical protein [Acidobacteriaceae bacterium]